MSNEPFSAVIAAHKGASGRLLTVACGTELALLNAMGSIQAFSPPDKRNTWST